MNAEAKVISLFSALPGPVRGVARMILAALSYACPYGVVRHLSQAIPVFEIVFLRSFPGLLLMLPWLARASLGALQTQRMGIYWLRTGLNYFGMSCLMYGIAHLALQDVTALMFTVPLFTVMFVACCSRKGWGRRSMCGSRRRRCNGRGSSPWGCSARRSPSASPARWPTPMPAW